MPLMVKKYKTIEAIENAIMVKRKAILLGIILNL